MSERGSYKAGIWGRRANQESGEVMCIVGSHAQAPLANAPSWGGTVKRIDCTNLAPEIIENDFWQ